jgi:hypothetical protein
MVDAPGKYLYKIVDISVILRGRLNLKIVFSRPYCGQTNEENYKFLSPVTTEEINKKRVNTADSIE